MNKQDYIEELQRLRRGEIIEITVERADFIQFRNAWLTLDNREAYVGEAGLNGTVIYRYVKLNK